MTKPPYFGRALLWQLLLLPIFFQVGGIAFFFLAVGVGSLAGSTGLIIVSSLLGLVFIGGCVHSGRRTIRQTLGPAALANSAPSTDSVYNEPRFWMRYLPVIVSFAYTLIVAAITLLRPIPAEGALFGPAAEVLAIAHITSSPVIVIGTIFGAPSPWFYLFAPLTIYAAYGCGLAWGYRELPIRRTRLPGGLFAVAMLAVALGLIAWRIDFMRTQILSGDPMAFINERTFNADHHPFEPGNQLVVISSPTLTIAENHPRLDGATAAYPIYAAAIQSIYKNVDARRAHDLVISSTTPEAYDRLIAGDTDLIFVAQPSTEQRAKAEAVGHPLQLTPIAKEAFVFFVHADNPVDGLTSDQIRAIYTKKITNWKEVGGRDEPILPFQRPAGSGSQTALELKVMKGEKLPAPLREEYSEGMGGVIQRVASYQNSTRAIGYSFRVYATTLNTKNEIKLLKIDGVAPIRETIRSATYPYTVNVYAATAGTPNPHVPQLLTWFLSPQGQHLIDETGYVSLPPAP